MFLDFAIELNFSINFDYKTDVVTFYNIFLLEKLKLHFEIIKIQ